jgi:hypothetical protein
MIIRFLFIFAQTLRIILCYEHTIVGNYNYQTWEKK